MFLESVMQTVATALMTYALHSSILLGCALIFARFAGQKRPAIAESLLRVAFLGALVTTGLQIGLDLKPLTGSKAIFQNEVQLSADSVPLPSSMKTEPHIAAVPENTLIIYEREAVPQEETAANPVLERTSSPSLSAIPVEILVVSLWLLPALALLLHFGVSWFLFFGRIKDREEVRDQHLLMTLAATLAGQRPMRGIRLTVSPYLNSPVAFGLFCPEICIPQKVLDADPAHRESLLAHEVAHLLARDPFWLVVYRILESLFFFQPLHRIARKKLQEIAEYRCDHYAAVHTGKPLDLARCLTEVASWQVGHGGALPVPGMTGSELGRRVHRLLDFSSRATYKLPKWVLPAAMVGLIALAPTMPGFSVAHSETKKSTEAPTPPTAAILEINPEAQPAPEAKPAVAEEPLPAMNVRPKPTVIQAPALTSLAENDALPPVRPRSQHAPAALAPASEILSVIDQGEVEEISDNDRIITEIQVDELVEYFEDMMEEEFDALADRLDDIADEAEDRYEDNILLSWRADSISDKFELLEEQIDATNDHFDDLILDIEMEWESETTESDEQLQMKLEKWRQDYRQELTRLTKEVNRYERKYTR